MATPNHLLEQTPASARRGRRPSLLPRPRRTSYRRNPVVTIMKVLLPASVVALILLVGAWPQLRPSDDRFRLEIAAVGPTGSSKPQLLNPRVIGIDGRSRPFQITADYGSRALSESGREVYVLDQPKADLTTVTGAWVAVTADRGHYQEHNQTLDLQGNVNLFHDNGTEFVTSAATMDLRDHSATGDQPITGQGPAGLIQAEGFRLLDGGERVLFTGKARMTLFTSPGPE